MLLLILYRFYFNNFMKRILVILSLILFYMCSDESAESFDVSKVKFKRQEGYNASEILNSQKIIEFGNSKQDQRLADSGKVDVVEYGNSTDISYQSNQIESISQNSGNEFENYVVIGTCEDMINGQEDQIFKSRERINLLIDDNADLKNRVDQLEKRLNTVINQRNSQERQIRSLESQKSNLDGLVEILKDEIK